MGGRLATPLVRAVMLSQESTSEFDGEIFPRNNLFTWKKAIDGEIKLTVHEDSVKFDGIWIQLVTIVLPLCKQEVKAGVTISDISPNNPTTTLIGPVWPVNGLTATSRMLRGTVKFEFKLELKEGKIPVSLRSHLAEIQHHLVLISSVSGCWRILASASMKTMTGCYDLSLIRPVQARMGRATLVGIRTGNEPPTSPPDLAATMQLEKQAYIAGERIKGVIVIENYLEEPVSAITLKMTRKEFAEHCEDVHSIQELIRRKELDVPDQNTAPRLEVEFAMTVPAVYPSWRKLDDAMVISYWVQFTVQTNKLVKVRGEQLIQIGTHYSRKGSQ